MLFEIRNSKFDTIMGQPHSLGRFIFIAGVILAGVGLLLQSGFKLPWLGRLPGDIAIRRDGFSFYVPLTSCLVISTLLSAIFWIIGRFR